MSLLLHRRAIERAVLGELTPREDARLRSHLARCGRCREHYDGLARTAEALGGGRAAAAQARTRLFAALALDDARPDTGRDANPGHDAARTRTGRRVWLGAAVALVPVAAVVMLWVSRDGDEVTLRGGETRETPPPATVVLYARSKVSQTSIRVAGELPGSGEARVSRGDYLLFGLRGLRTRTHVRISAVDQQGRLHDYVGDTAVGPAPGPLTLGRSIDVARAHEPGRLRMVVLFSDKEIDDAAVRAAVARLGAPRTDRGPADPTGTTLVTGLVVIAP